MRLNKLAIYVFLMILLVYNVAAMGLAPTRNVINFEPGLEKESSFRIINSENENLKLAIYPRGELAEYIELEKNLISIKADQKEAIIKYSINLPNELEPGLVPAEILVIPIPEENNIIITDEENSMIFDQNRGIIEAKIALLHQIRVNVPYTGKYLQGKLHVSEASVNETARFTISLFNLGKEDIDNIKATVIIKGPTNEEIAVLRTDSISIKSQDESKLVTEWKAEVGEGKYYAEVIVQYDGKTILLNKIFNIGNQEIKIEKLEVENFRLGTIAKFDILLRSRWNEPISHVYADMEVIDKSGTIINQFKTTPIDMQPYETSEIHGYWDTQNVEPGEYDVNIKLKYLNKMTEKLFETVVTFDSIDVKQALTGRVVREEDKIPNSVLILIVLILIGINLGWFLYFKKIKGKIK
jgi:hypothetical protein